MLLGRGSSVPRPVAKTTLAAALIGLAGAAPAAAQTGGAAAAPTAPSVSGIVCRTGCGAGGTVAQGGTITLRGRVLDRATAVVFLGGAGTRDDVRVAIRAASATRADVRVPATARSGRIALVSAAGVSAQAAAAPLKVSKALARPLTVEEPAAPTLAPVNGIAQLDAGIAKRKAGASGASAVTVAYVSHAAGEIAVRVDIVRRADGLSIFSDARTVSAEQPQTLTWNGRAGGTVALDGRYEVRISAGGATGSRTATVDAAPAAGGAAPEGAAPPPGSTSLGAFTFVGAVFPVRGTHDYGQGAARFGSGRSGHSHEGQDVMAQCGTPVVAARGGVVKQKASHYAAGNYVIVSDPVSGQDFGYMHFRTPAVVKRGDIVETGQLLGYVGDTGSASACHLHFEIWTAPGWYSGGSPIDPLATLKRWDKLG